MSTLASIRPRRTTLPWSRKAPREVVIDAVGLVCNAP